MAKEEQMYMTDTFQLLEKHKNYNRLKHINSDATRCIDFYHGRQWLEAETGSIEPITYNIIKPIIKYKNGVINANGYDIIFTPNNHESAKKQKEMEAVCKNINNYMSKYTDIIGLTVEAQKAIKMGSITSEGILYFDFKEDEQQEAAEYVSKGNLFLSDETNPELQEQPYMIITFRRDVQATKEQARENGISEELIANIVEDGDSLDVVSPYAKDEVNKMITIALKMWKKNGKIYYKKDTLSCPIQEETDSGRTLYPVAHYIFEQEEGSARGLGGVLHNIPNQIEINRTAMRRALAVKMGAYPKMVVNEGKVTNPESLDEAGSRIKIKDMEVDDVNKIVGYLRPAQMSIDSEKFQEEIISKTRELDGAGDIATGNVNPEDASGRAILAVQNASREPLTEQVNNVKKFYKDIALILFETWQLFYPKGKIITIKEPDDQGNQVEKDYKIPTGLLKQIKPNVEIDITPRSPFDNMAQELSLEKLLTTPRADGYITFEEFVDSLGYKSTMPKAKLEVIIENRKEAARVIEKINKDAMMKETIVKDALKEEMARAEVENRQQPMQEGVQNAM